MACNRIVPLTCAVQKYEWGKLASDSLVAQLNGVTDSNDTYAELWMGTHPKGPSALKSGEPLIDWINNDPARLGDATQKFGMENGGLPFLLKVLSIRKALSIQAHPTKEHAKILHQTLPQHYPDSNHKPEMAIALTQFEGLCGFRPIEEIMSHLQHLRDMETDLEVIIPHSDIYLDSSTPEDYIKRLFTSLISSPKLSDIVVQIYNALQNKVLIEADKLFLRIYEQHPGDKGLICIYLLNHVILEPGECMFLGPNKIHAYFSGDCIECMACSDNTVRSGFTRKFIDVETLCGMLDYSPGTAESQKLPSKTSGHITSYLPPIDDFAVNKIEINSYQTIPAHASPSIMICVSGCGSVAYSGYSGEDDERAEMLDVRAGSVFYVCPDTEIVAGGGMLLFMAFCR